MTEKEKLNELKKLFSILLDFVEKHKLLSYNTKTWSDKIQDIMGYINYSESHNLNTHDTLVKIKDMTSSLYPPHNGLDEFGWDQDLDKSFEKAQNEIWEIVKEYRFERSKI